MVAEGDVPREQADAVGLVEIFQSIHRAIKHGPGTWSAEVVAADVTAAALLTLATVIKSHA